MIPPTDAATAAMIIVVVLLLPLLAWSEEGEDVGEVATVVEECLWRLVVDIIATTSK